MYPLPGQSRPVSGILKRLDVAIDVRFLTRVKALQSFLDNEWLIRAWQGEGDLATAADEDFHAPAKLATFTDEDFHRAGHVRDLLGPVQTSMLQAEKGNSSPNEVTGAFAFLANCGKLVSQTAMVARTVAAEAADLEPLGSEFPVQIGRAACRLRSGVVQRLLDYHSRDPETARMLAQAAMLSPRSSQIMPEISQWLVQADDDLREKRLAA